MLQQSAVEVEDPAVKMEQSTGARDSAPTLAEPRTLPSDLPSGVYQAGG
ncbi:hypothetical protein [Pilimelia columellifera]